MNTNIVNEIVDNACERYYQSCITDDYINNKLKSNEPIQQFEGLVYQIERNTQPFNLLYTIREIVTHKTRSWIFAEFNVTAIFEKYEQIAEKALRMDIAYKNFTVYCLELRQRDKVKFEEVSKIPLGNMNSLVWLFLQCYSWKTSKIRRNKNGRH